MGLYLPLTEQINTKSYKNLKPIKCTQPWGGGLLWTSFHDCLWRPSNKDPLLYYFLAKIILGFISRLGKNATEPPFRVPSKQPIEHHLKGPKKEAAIAESDLHWIICSLKLNHGNTLTAGYISVMFPLPPSNAYFCFCRPITGLASLKSVIRINPSIRELPPKNFNSMFSTVLRIVIINFTSLPPHHSRITFKNEQLRSLHSLGKEGELK